MKIKLLNEHLHSVVFANMNSMTEDQLRYYLKPLDVSFVAIGINRAQSMLLCELCDSYTQQSQRYVSMEDANISVPTRMNKRIILRIKNIAKDAVELYNKMTVLRPSVSKSGRKTVSDFEYGIPYEDARYVLPLATTTNITVTMSGDKLIDLYVLMLHHMPLFREMLAEFMNIIPTVLHDTLIKIASLLYHKTFDQSILYGEYFNKLDADNNVIMIKSNTLYEAAIGILTSQNAEAPDDVFKSSYDGADVYKNVTNLINRVTGYGHMSVLEHHRTTFAMECSLTAYHQVIRHRIQNISRESLSSLIDPNKFTYYIPDSIAVSKFKSDYINLMDEYHSLLIDMADGTPISRELLILALPNAKFIKFIVSSNARADNQIFTDRLCLTAQTEIRELYKKKFDYLYDIYPELYKYGVPPCVTSGVCKEGKLSCGRVNYMRQMFSEIHDESNKKK